MSLPVGKPEGKTLEMLVYVGGRTEIIVKEIGWVVFWIELAHVKVQWRVLSMRWAIG